MNISEEYISSFTFSILLEDISSKLQLQRRYSEQNNNSPPEKTVCKLSISTVDSINDEPENKHFSLLKVCPNFERYKSNCELSSFRIGQPKASVKDKKIYLKHEFYRKIIDKLSH